MKKFYNRVISFLFALSLLITSLPVEAIAATTQTDKMEVHFIDVGQGDSTFIKCGGRTMLIDAGDDTKGTAIQNYIRKQGIDHIDYLVLTHPDSDHIGGAPVIITKFGIDRVFVSNFEKDNKTYQKLIQSLDDKRLKAITPTVGSKFPLGSAKITILAPVKEYDNPNDSSIALLIRNGENKFLFSGDAEESAENDIVNANTDIKADVYHAGHHGSRTSTSQKFFEAVSPKYAVISCAEGNSYGHPNAETLNTFRMNGVKVYRTDEEGTIIATSDGTNIKFDVPASETWKAGEPTGSSAASSTRSETATAVKETVAETQTEDTKELTYVLNTKTKKFHKPSCSYLPTSNRRDSSESRDSIINKGYVPCKKCNP